MGIKIKIKYLFKALSWRVTATIITTAIVFIASGRLDFALKIGLAEGVIKILVYILHETMWEKLGD